MMASTFRAGPWFSGIEHGRTKGRAKGSWENHDMPTIHLEAEVSTEELVKAAAQLEAPEFNQLVARLLDLRAQRLVPRLSASEADLLTIINQGLPAALRQRYDELTARRDAHTLTPAEHAELLGLTNQVENLEAQRAEALVALAALRKRPLSALMQDLGLSPPSHG
jgi:hypothetical protein